MYFYVHLSRNTIASGQTISLTVLATAPVPGAYVHTGYEICSVDVVSSGSVTVARQGGAGSANNQVRLDPSGVSWPTVGYFNITAHDDTPLVLQVRILPQDVDGNLDVDGSLFPQLFELGGHFNNLNDFQDIFKKFGKIMVMGVLGGPMITDIEKSHMGLVDQASSGLPSEFEINQDVIAPLGSNVKSITDSIGKLSAITIAASNTLLNKYIAVNLGLSALPARSQLQSALTAQMLAATPLAAKVAPSGIMWRYFNDNLNIQLPQGNPITIPDVYAINNPPQATIISVTATGETELTWLFSDVLIGPVPDQNVFGGGGDAGPVNDVQYNGATVVVNYSGGVVQGQFYDWDNQEIVTGNDVVFLSSLAPDPQSDVVL